MSFKIYYKNNPNCSKILVNKGKTIFVYFYYRTPDGKRKMIKFSEGLNDPGLTERKLNIRINDIVQALDESLRNEFFDGTSFISLGPDPNKEIVTDLIDKYIENKKDLIAEKSIVNYENSLKFFKGYIKESLTIDRVNTEFIENCIKYMVNHKSKKTKEHFSPNTMVDYKDNLKRFFKWCVAKGYLQTDPFNGANLGTSVKKMRSARHKTFTIDEWQKIIYYFIRHPWKAFLTVFLIIYYTHMRPIEIFRLQNKEIDLDNRQIKIHASKLKNRRARKIPIDKPLWDHLKSLNLDLTTNPDNYFVGVNGDKRSDRITFNAVYKYTSERFYGIFITCKKHLGLDPKCTPYGVKHTASVHEFLYEGMSKEQIKVKSGHASIEQTEEYMRTLEDIINIPDYQERKLHFDLGIPEEKEATTKKESV